MATTYNKTGVTVASGVPTTNDLGAIESHASSYVLKGVVDLTGETTLTSADIYQCLAIPADTLVTQVWVKLVTAATGTALTATVGDGADPNGWDAATDLGTTAGTVTYGVVGTDAYLADDAATAQGKFYTTADTIDLVLATVTAITAGPKFEVYANCISIN